MTEHDLSRQSRTQSG